MADELEQNYLLVLAVLMLGLPAVLVIRWLQLNWGHRNWLLAVAGAIYLIIAAVIGIVRAAMRVRELLRPR